MSMSDIGTDHFTMTTHLSLLVTLTWLRIIDNSLWKTFDNHENNITLKYRNTFVTVTSDRKEGKSGLLLANILITFKISWVEWPCYTLKILKWTGMEIPFWVRIYGPEKIFVFQVTFSNILGSVSFSLIILFVFDNWKLLEASLKWNFHFQMKCLFWECNDMKY